GDRHGPIWDAPVSPSPGSGSVAACPDARAGPRGKFGVLARLSRARERSVRRDVSTRAQRRWALGAGPVRASSRPMMEDPMISQRSRLETGVPGLDVVLGGGLLKGGIYLLTGGPGTGKTVIANQICFHHAREGGRCLYVTLLAESHSRLLTNL